MVRWSGRPCGAECAANDDGAGEYPPAPVAASVSSTAAWKDQYESAACESMAARRAGRGQEVAGARWRQAIAESRWSLEATSGDGVAGAGWRGRLRRLDVDSSRVKPVSRQQQPRVCGLLAGGRRRRCFRCSRDAACLHSARNPPKSKPTRGEAGSSLGSSPYACGDCARAPRPPFLLLVCALGPSLLLHLVGPASHPPDPRSVAAMLPLSKKICGRALELAPLHQASVRE